MLCFLCAIGVNNNWNRATSDKKNVMQRDKSGKVHGLVNEILTFDFLFIYFYFYI